LENCCELFLKKSTSSVLKKPNVLSLILSESEKILFEKFKEEDVQKYRKQ
jgi:hypothetical protein